MPDSTRLPKLTVINLRKRFGNHIVLDGANLTLVGGETTVLIGASGSGKSVLAKCILGLLPIDGGEIAMGETKLGLLSVRQRAGFLRQFGALFQRGALFDSLPVWHNVAFGLMEGKGMDRAQAKDIALQRLAEVGLGADVAELMPAELSGGMQKRVALARAIAARPQYLILDEPTEGLDPIMAAIVNNFVVKTVSDLGAATLAITNNIASARKIATRIAMLQHGTITWQGRAIDLDRSGNEYVERFIRGR